MNMKYRYGIGPAGRWFIFAGLPLAICAVLFVIMDQNPALERALGPTVFPYLGFAVSVVIVIVGMVLYGRFPKGWIIPLGLLGWLINVSLLGWYFWFGPGAR